jgi:hypothetical protein
VVRFVIGRDLSDPCSDGIWAGGASRRPPMHVLAMCGAIVATLYVAIRLGMRFYFPPET